LAGLPVIACNIIHSFGEIAPASVFNSAYEGRTFTGATCCLVCISISPSAGSVLRNCST